MQTSFRFALPEESGQFVKLTGMSPTVLRVADGSAKISVDAACVHSHWGKARCRPEFTPALFELADEMKRRE
jgi:hypothetical protein